MLVMIRPYSICPIQHAQRSHRSPKVLALWTLVLALLASNPNVLAADWYLDSIAAGSNTGADRANAWTSPIHIAKTNVKPGDTIWVAPGNYADRLELLGFSDITVRILQDSSAAAVFPSMQLYNCNFVTIDGLVGTNQFFFLNSKHPTLGHSVNLRLSANLLLRGISIDRNDSYELDTKQQHGIRVWNECGKFVIEQCSVANTTGDGINVTQINYTGSESSKYDWITIRNCTLTRLGDDGIQLGANRKAQVLNCTMRQLGFKTFFGMHPDAIQLNPEGGNIWIEGNFMEDFTQLVFLERVRSNVVICNNILSSTKKKSAFMGIACSTLEPFEGDYVIANNLFVDFRSYGAISASFPINRANTIIANNIFLNCKRGTVSSKQTDYVGPSNFWWDAPDTIWYDTDGNVAAPVVPRNFGQALARDPRLDRQNSYRPLPSSPVIGSAQNLSSLFVLDKDGRARGDTWEAGPYSSSKSNTPTPPTGLRVVH